MATTKHGKRKKLTYKPVLNLPPLPEDQRLALRDNIAVNGVLVPILTDGGSPRRRIIDGCHRKEIADELGYDCPEIIRDDLTEEELRTLARALNLARRQMTAEQKRALIADQLEETPERSNRWVGKQLGVTHPTVASVRAEMESSGKLNHCQRLVSSDGRMQASLGKYRPGANQQQPVRSEAERQARIAATTLIHGDCRHELRKIASRSIDCVISDPIYPEVDREYGKISEREWHDLMRDVVRECRRVLKPKGSAVFIIQPNYEKLGRMRLWPWEFLLWAAKEWNLVQDAYWHATDAMPLAGTERTNGLLRASMKMCVWLGPPDCYRNQDRVLKPISEPVTARVRPDERKAGPAGHTRRCGTMHRTANLRGGSTPFNVLSIPKGGGSPGAEGHPAVTPIAVADWWCRYLLPPGGVLLDCFAGSGTMLEAGLNNGASKVIGIEKEAKYLKTCRGRIAEG